MDEALLFLIMNYKYSVQRFKNIQNKLPETKIKFIETNGIKI